MRKSDEKRSFKVMTKKVRYCDLGRMGYGEALEVQHKEFGRLLNSTDASDAGTIFTVEHPAVYTLGKNGEAGNLLVSESFLRGTGAEFYRTDRGGDITFHGEGQIVGYPILHLGRAGVGVRSYINSLEQAVIDVLAEYGIASGRSEGASGVWLWDGVTAGESAGKDARLKNLRKICAIGVRVSRYITMHGFALNVTTDLSRFGLINPCGFRDRGVTSMERELGYGPDMSEVRMKTANRLSELLGVAISN